MKNLFFVLALAFGLMSFTPANDVEIIETNPVSTQVMEDDAFPCWVRECIWIDGVKYCTEWEEADCTIIIIIE